MSRQLLPILAGLVGVGLLTLLCANHHRPHFEADLSGRTTEALAKAGVAGAAVRPEGQIVELNGVVASEEIKRRAGEEAARIHGVEEVRNNLRVEAGPPPMTAVERKAAEDCQAEFNRRLGQANVRFATSSARILAASYPLLDALAAAANGCAAARIEIGGHTDRRGGLEMNMRLSQARAESVMAYLVSKGVAADRLTAVGYGPNQPVAGNDTREAMSKNRRTEFKVKGL